MKRSNILALPLLALALAGCGLVQTTSAPPTPTAPPLPQATAAPENPPPTIAPTVESPPVAAAPTPAIIEPTPTSAPPPVISVVVLPDPEAYQWRQLADGLEKPVGLAHAADGSGRLFIIEQAGRIRIYQDGALAPGNFLDITDRVGSQANEQGLLGLAFHPRYRENGYFYVNYTDANGDTVVSRFQVSPDAQRADAGSELILLQIDQPYTNHNGGCLAFGPDGYLYIGTGDGGNAADPIGNGQSLQTLLGKILRIDVDAAAPYAIPAGNPFAAGGGLPEIWAYGLRNPWRFTFDRATGDLWIGDVGQALWEEVNFLPAGSPGGANFGWDYREGLHPFEGQPPAGLALTDPVLEYPHNPGYSVTGGYVYRGSALPGFQGVYVYGDYLSGHIFTALRLPGGSWLNQKLVSTHVAISSFGEDEAGELYFVSHQGGLYRLEGK